MPTKKTEMKQLTYIAIAIAFLAGTAVMFDACKKEKNEDPNSEEGYTFTDPRDGQTYNIVTIGSQTWFAENLKYETNNSWCYDDDGSNCNEYGRLYTWGASKSACPSGWHLPSDNEWKTLEMHLGMSQSEADITGWRGTDEGKKLKSTSGWYNDGNGIDAVGFKALPGGYRVTFGDFINYSDLGRAGHWWSATEHSFSNLGNKWSATEHSSARGWSRYLSEDVDEIAHHGRDKQDGFSVRCVRD